MGSVLSSCDLNRLGPSGLAFWAPTSGVAPAGPGGQTLDEFQAEKLRKLIEKYSKIKDGIFDDDDDDEDWDKNDLCKLNFIIESLLQLAMFYCYLISNYRGFTVAK